MCDPKFCSMKITQDVRDCAATFNDKEQRIAQMSEKLKAMGEQVYMGVEVEAEAEAIRSFGDQITPSAQ
jgi:phosphomethylpyrimidine synthase